MYTVLVVLWKRYECEDKNVLIYAISLEIHDK